MGKTTADDAARELLLTTTNEREAHAMAVQALLARNASMRTNDELVDEALRTDPEFRAEWTRTALGRAIAVAVIRFREEHELTQRDLVERLGLTPLQVADLESGEVTSEPDSLERLASRLGIRFTADGSPS